MVGTSRWCGQPDGRCAACAAGAGNPTACEGAPCTVGAAWLMSRSQECGSRRSTLPPFGGGSRRAPARRGVGAFRVAPESWVCPGVPEHRPMH